LDSSGSRQGLVAGFSEYNNEFSCPIRQEFLDYLIGSWILKKDSSPKVSYKIVPV
jgi:hypothetical protein